MVHAQKIMGDTIPNYSDLDDGFDTAYVGLSDTGTGFSGSSTLQDTSLGSPVLLDSSYGPQESVSVLDGMISDDPVAAQSLSGISDTPIGSAAQSTPTPNVSQPSAATANGLSALSKLGASFATLFGGAPKTVVAAPASSVTPAGAALIPGAASGTTTLILLVVVGAMVILLLRGD
jgi:hypothetical protein